jgi:hypothetical protein
MVDHAEILVELIQILTDETEVKTPKEIMEEIVSIIDDYKSELTLEENEQQKRNDLTMMGVDPDKEENNSSEELENVVAKKQINRAFLLTKAKKEYYKKHGLSEDDEEKFTNTEKMKHRKGITAIFNNMVIEEQNKEDVPSIYAKGPFKKVPGNVSVNRKISDEELEDDEEITPAQNKWKKSRLQELKRNIRNVKASIDELERQNKISKISASIVSRNDERIAELEDELADLEEQKQQYQ